MGFFWVFFLFFWLFFFLQKTDMKCEIAVLFNTLAALINNAEITSLLDKRGGGGGIKPNVLKHCLLNKE